MNKIMQYIGKDVHKETVAAAIVREAAVGIRYTRFARPAEPESEG